jgi:hypothetical protein
MINLTKIVIWLCKKFNRKQLEFIVANLVDVLNDKRSEIKPKDDFKEKHPHYRDFYVDPKLPLDASDKAKKKSPKNWRKIIDDYKKKRQTNNAHSTSFSLSHGPAHGAMY